MRVSGLGPFSAGWLCLAVVVPLGAGHAQTLVAARPGLMCAEPESLARLTLPDGSSRVPGPYATPADFSIKVLGGCIDIPPDARVAVKSMRHNTSIVTYDPGAGERTFIVPNVDFRFARP